MENLYDEVILNIKACLISCKGKIPIKQLENDYYTLIGEKIPFKKLGFKNSVDLISKEKTLSLIQNGSGEYMVDTKASSKTSHITEMVNRQKDGKKKKFIPRKAAVPQNWKPKVRSRPAPLYTPSSRTKAVQHSQIVISPKPVVASRVSIPEHSSFSKKKTPLLTETPVKNEKYPIEPIRRRIMSNVKITDNSEKRLSDEIYVNVNTVNQSSRKRLTQKMSEISLERDSGNSSPTSDFKSSAGLSFDFVQTGNPIDDLKRFIEVYKVPGFSSNEFKNANKRGPPTFNFKIEVDGATYLSYPETFHSSKEAEIYCSKKALDHLLLRHVKRRSLPISEPKDVKEQVPEMLRPHAHGVWSTQIEKDYQDKFGEQLPSNWVEIVDSLPCVMVEKFQDKHALYYCLPGTKGLYELTRAIPSEISVPQSQVVFNEVTGHIWGQITCFMSLKEVWCIQWDTDDYLLFTDMCAQMESFYEREDASLKVSMQLPINMGNYYVANYDDSWLRIRALVDVSANCNEKVECINIDTGETFLVKRKDIYRLDRKFAQCQAQAFVCRLYGLEDLYEMPIDNEKLWSYVGKTVTLESVPTNNENEDSCIPVIIYDENGHSINEHLLKYYTFESAKPDIKINKSIQVNITHIEPNGDIYFKVQSNGSKRLDELLEVLQIDMKNPPAEALEKPQRNKTPMNKLFIAKKKVDGLWYRIRVCDYSPDGVYAQILYVDHGSTEIIKLKDAQTYALDKLSEPLYMYAEQAVRVQFMHDFSLPDNFTELLTSKLMPIGSDVLCKVIDISEEKVMRAEFYKRSVNGELLCINKSLSMEMELKKSVDATSFNSNTLVRLTELDSPTRNVPSGGSLVRPAVPCKGEFFPVKIPYSVNPWNFFVQPYESQPRLDNMMQKMQEYYNGLEDLDYPAVETVMPGNIYATKHEDGIWYRVSVLKVIQSWSVSIFYADIGYYSVVAFNELIPLQQDFMKLPYQALKAKLSGIKPKDKWSIDDCDRFVQIVNDKAFVAVIVDIIKDDVYDSDMVIELKLLDTTGEDDIDIGKLLIEKKIAVNIN